MVTMMNKLNTVVGYKKYAGKFKEKLHFNENVSTLHGIEEMPKDMTILLRCDIV